MPVNPKDILMSDDGFYYYWPDMGRGMYSSQHLREIADYLDKTNEEWDKLVSSDPLIN